MEEKTEKQVSETQWYFNGQKCLIRIEIDDGEIDEQDIIVQARYTIKGLGYGINIEMEQEDGKKT